MHNTIQVCRKQSVHVMQENVYTFIIQQILPMEEK